MRDRLGDLERTRAEAVRGRTNRGMAPGAPVPPRDDLLTLEEARGYTTESPRDAYEDGLEKGWRDGVAHALAVLETVLETTDATPQFCRRLMREIDGEVTRTRIGTPTLGGGR